MRRPGIFSIPPIWITICVGFQQPHHLIGNVTSIEIFDLREVEIFGLREVKIKKFYEKFEKKNYNNNYLYLHTTKREKKRHFCIYYNNSVIISC